MIEVLREADTVKRAGDEIRTRDVQLGRLTLYQLSYSRNATDSAPTCT